MANFKRQGVSFCCRTNSGGRYQNYWNGHLRSVRYSATVRGLAAIVFFAENAGRLRPTLNPTKTTIPYKKRRQISI